jgi:nickel-type superoxide dismutase maturation protease
MDLLLSCQIMVYQHPTVPLAGAENPGGQSTVTGRAVRRRWPLWRVAVAERSMEPSYRPGDWLLVRRVRPGRGSAVRPGAVVIARHPARPTLLLIKRAARREPAGWWLAADNPGAGAADSGTFGAVPADGIEGVVLGRYWPLRRCP